MFCLSNWKIIWIYTVPYLVVRKLSPLVGADLSVTVVVAFLTGLGLTILFCVCDETSPWFPNPVVSGWLIMRQIKSSCTGLVCNDLSCHWKRRERGTEKQIREKERDGEGWRGSLFHLHWLDQHSPRSLCHLAVMSPARVNYKNEKSRHVTHSRKQTHTHIQTHFLLRQDHYITLWRRGQHHIYKPWIVWGGML